MTGASGKGTKAKHLVVVFAEGSGNHLLKPGDVIIREVQACQINHARIFSYH
jgi:hypothetical protein